MDTIRQRLTEYASRPETYVPVEARAFGHLDLAFYDRTQHALQTLGFALLGDYEIAELKGRSGDMHCFIRAMIARDGTTVAALFHPKPALWLRLLLRVTGKPLGKMIELETEFSDDTFIANGTPPVLLFDPPPLLTRQHHPAGTSVEKLFARHSAQVRGYLAANPGVTIRRVTDAAGMIRMQTRQHDIKAVYRQMVGGMTAEEIRRFGGLTRERAARLKRLMDGETPQQVETNPATLPPFPAGAATEDLQVPWWKRDLSERGIGFLLLFCGLGLGYLGFYQPWQEAGHGAPRLNLSYKGAVIAVMLFGMSLPRILAPQWSIRVLGSAQHPNKVGYIVLVALAFAGLATVGWFKGYLETFGYQS